MNVALILGTRPEIIKMSPIIREFERQNMDYFIIHTGQHYSYEMDKIFFDQLDLPESKYNLDVGPGIHGEQTGKIITGIERVLMQEKPDVVLVQGDTNTVLAGALAASKLHIIVGHVEAGLRSYDNQMPEEINRVLTDHCSDYLFVPTEGARETLLNEGIDEEKIFVTGNTIVDAVRQNMKIASQTSTILDDLDVEPKKYLLATAHRQENVDDPKRFFGILHGLELVAEAFDIPVIYPIHPRSRKQLQKFGIQNNGRITFIDPVGFLSFLQLESNGLLVLTDSGGVQEEACIMGIPCVTMRDNTERPETVEVGANMIAGTEAERIMECARVMMDREPVWSNPFGEGTAAEKIRRVLKMGMRSEKQ